MEARRDFAVVVEAFVPVGFAIAVEVMQVRDLIAAMNVDFIVDDLQAQRLEHAGGVAASR